MRLLAEHERHIAQRSANATEDRASPLANPKWLTNSGPVSADLLSGKRVPMGKNVWFEVQGERRRVLIQAEVCLREGLLEQLMCRRQTKEHEAILAADLDARNIHKALLLTGATPGSTVQYQPQFKAPSGARIKVTLQYDRDGKTVQVPAQQWVADTKSHKELAFDWVFAGSHLYENPLDKNAPPAYAANSGDVICVSNFETAMLDLPINSSNDNTELEFEANTKRVPPLGTTVLVILEPIKQESKK